MEFYIMLFSQKNEITMERTEEIIETLHQQCKVKGIEFREYPLVLNGSRVTILLDHMIKDFDKMYHSGVLSIQFLTTYFRMSELHEVGIFVSSSHETDTGELIIACGDAEVRGLNPVEKIRCYDQAWVFVPSAELAKGYHQSRIEIEAGECIVQLHDSATAKVSELGIIV